MRRFGALILRGGRLLLALLLASYLAALVILIATVALVGTGPADDVDAKLIALAAPFGLLVAGIVALPVIVLVAVARRRRWRSRWIAPLWGCLLGGFGGLIVPREGGEPGSLGPVLVFAAGGLIGGATFAVAGGWPRRSLPTSGG